MLFGTCRIRILDWRGADSGGNAVLMSDAVIFFSPFLSTAIALIHWFACMRFTSNHAYDRAIGCEVCGDRGGYFSYENSCLSLISHFSGSNSTSFLFPISPLPTSCFPLLISHFPHIISHFSFHVSHFMW